MAWYHEALFYHIYPLGLLGAPKTSGSEGPVSRLRSLWPWVEHLKSLGVTALYIGPLFSSGSHGYDTSDYRQLDARLGTNADLKDFVRLCHEAGVRVVLDAVFNHSGRDFFAFRDLREKREGSRYRDWYCNVNFRGDTEYHDGFSYGNWGGYNLLAKFNLRNPEVVNYHLDTVRFWVSEFDIDGLRLDTADVLDFDFLRSLRRLANEIKPGFWLLGEVIHGEYQRWVNPDMLHSVTNYALQKALYSGHNDRNYFEIAHTLHRQTQNGLDCRALYSFVDNHDVERICTKLVDRRNWLPVHILLYCLPGVPSLYYGSEFGIEGRKVRGGSDDAIRPALELEALLAQPNPYLETLQRLGALYRQEPALSVGDYAPLLLTTGQYAFRRGNVLVAVNNTDSEAALTLPCADGAYQGALHGGQYPAENGQLSLRLGPCDGEILLPEGRAKPDFPPPSDMRLQTAPEAPQPPAQAATPDLSKPFEDMTVEELQAAILAKLARNGPVTEEMRRDVTANIWRDSLLNWIKSFR